MPTDHRHRRQNQQLTAISLQAAQLTGLLAQAYTAIELTLPDGYPTGGSEPVSGGDIGRPTEGAVLERERVLESIEDPGGNEARCVGLAAVDTSLTVAVAALREAHQELTQITARLHAGKVGQRTNMADCQACERPVANTPNDRLRAGYCNACRMAWNRQGQPDRPAFERGRRGMDTAPVPEVHTSGADVVDLTVAGVTVRLPADLAIEFHQLEQPTTDDIARLHAQAIETS
jgi:hypothetical protein